MYQMDYDDALSGRVIAALAAHPSICADCIRVHTLNRSVRLEGVVDTLFQRSLAEEVASAIPDVAAVENGLTVSADIDITDRVLQRSVDDELASAGMSGIGARVEGGTAELLGSVKTLAEQSRAVEIAEKVSGLRGVINNIRLTEQNIEDLKLGEIVVKAISDNPEIRPMNMLVEVENGAVRVSGEVPERNQITLITAIIERIPGAKEIDSNFTVRPLREQRPDSEMQGRMS